MGKEANFRERALYAISPKKGNELYQRRMKREAEAETPEGRRDSAIRMAASYFGRHGASNTLNTMIGWLVGGGGAEDDIDVHGPLRARPPPAYRSRALFRSVAPWTSISSSAPPPPTSQPIIVFSVLLAPCRPK